MKRVGRSSDKEIWLDIPERPYHVTAPVAGKPFVCALFIADSDISNSEQMNLSRQLVAAGCRYAVCAGLNCGAWDDSIDIAYLETDPDFDPPDETMVMTTWHEGEPVADVLAFAQEWTNFDNNVFEHLLVLVLGDDRRLRTEIAAALGSPSVAD